MKLISHYYFTQKETPLANAAFWAARKGNLALLQLLLNSGRVDVDCRDSVCPSFVYAKNSRSLSASSMWHSGQTTSLFLFFQCQYFRMVNKALECSNGFVVYVLRSKEQSPNQISNKSTT